MVTAWDFITLSASGRVKWKQISMNDTGIRKPVVSIQCRSRRLRSGGIDYFAHVCITFMKCLHSLRDYHWAMWVRAQTIAMWVFRVCLSLCRAGRTLFADNAMRSIQRVLWKGWALRIISHNSKPLKATFVRLLFKRHVKVL